MFQIEPTYKFGLDYWWQSCTFSPIVAGVGRTKTAWDGGEKTRDALNCIFNQSHPCTLTTLDFCLIFFNMTWTTYGLHVSGVNIIVWLLLSEKFYVHFKVKKHIFLLYFTWQYKYPMEYITIACTNTVTLTKYPLMRVTCNHKWLYSRAYNIDSQLNSSDTTPIWNPPLSKVLSLRKLPRVYAAVS